MILIRGLIRSKIHFKQTYQMGMLTDKLTEKQTKKMQDQFKKQIQHLANKPSFTLMDYKQRIIDELNNLKGSFRKNLSKEAGDMQKKLQVEKKIVNALFEQQLVDKKKVDFLVKKEIALVTGVDLKKINDVFQKAESYRRMHKYLRFLSRTGIALPESMQQLQHKLQKSRFAVTGLQRRHMAYRTENKRCKGSLRNMRLRYIARTMKQKEQKFRVI